MTEATDALSTQKIILDKAASTVSSLDASFASGMISQQAFQTGVESVWNCLSGVFNDADFIELMVEANKAARAEPPSSATEVFTRASEMVVVIRSGEDVVCAFGRSVKSRGERFDMLDDAITKQRALKNGLQRAGWERIAC